MMKAFQRTAHLYNLAAGKSPLLVQSTTSGVVASVGDLGMQTYEGKRLGTFDYARTARMGFFRLLIFGPGYSLWIRQLDKVVKMPTFRTTVAAKVCCDQFIWAPPALAVFYVWTSVTEGKSFVEGFDRAKNNLWPTLMLNWPVWCTVQLVTFSVIPLQFRVGFVSFVQVFWSAVLSGLNEEARSKERENKCSIVKK